MVSTNRLQVALGLALCALCGRAFMPAAPSTSAGVRHREIVRIRSSIQSEDINNSSASCPRRARARARAIRCVSRRRDSEDQCLPAAGRQPARRLRADFARSSARMIKRPDAPRSYEKVVEIARKAKQRALLESMGDTNLNGVKPLIAQMNEELAARNAASRRFPLFFPTDVFFLPRRRRGRRRPASTSRGTRPGRPRSASRGSPSGRRAKARPPSTRPRWSFPGSRAK